jgi:hypothetical protein
LILIASNLTTRIETEQEFNATTSFSEAFLQKIEKDRNLLGLAKIKIFTPAGLTLYSTDVEDIGSNTDKAFFAELIGKQEPRTHLKVEDKTSSDEEIFMVETYVPIIKNGRAIGIFEIYYDMTATRSKLKDVADKISGIITAVSLVLLGAVLCSAYLTRRSHLLREKAEAEKDTLIKDLELALGEIKTLRGILPLCSFCKKIRDDSGYWKQVDVYLDQHSEADVSHGICPDCLAEQYPELSEKILANKQQSPSGDGDKDT